jgi:hypothetical protein
MVPLWAMLSEQEDSWYLYGDGRGVGLTNKLIITPIQLDKRGKGSFQSGDRARDKIVLYVEYLQVIHAFSCVRSQSASESIMSKLNRLHGTRRK